MGPPNCCGHSGPTTARIWQRQHQCQHTYIERLNKAYSIAIAHRQANGIESFMSRVVRIICVTMKRNCFRVRPRYRLSGAGRLSKNAYSHPDPAECEKNLAPVMSIPQALYFPVSESYRKEDLESIQADSCYLGVVVTLQNEWTMWEMPCSNAQ
jgi:hypothetical protein